MKRSIKLFIRQFRRAAAVSNIHARMIRPRLFCYFANPRKNMASQQNQGLLTSTASRSGTPLPLLPRNLQICPITASPLDSKGTISRSKGPTILLKAILGWQALGSRRNHMMRREGGKPLAGGLEK